MDKWYSGAEDGVIGPKVGKQRTDQVSQTLVFSYDL
jgi:hypothetical protein